jgi:hypothetical protein
MCCFITSLFLLGPRFATLIWWLINPVRFSAAFSSFIWPVLGIIFLPWTTLMYLIVWSPATGIYGLDWLCWPTSACTLAAATATGNAFRDTTNRRPPAHLVSSLASLGHAFKLARMIGRITFGLSIEAEALLWLA